jgi:hypothetical protein
MFGDGNKIFIRIIYSNRMHAVTQLHIDKFTIFNDESSCLVNFRIDKVTYIFEVIYSRELSDCWTLDSVGSIWINIRIKF